MGPADTFNIYSSNFSGANTITLTKLAVDGSNWPTYQERTMNTLTSKGLRRHVLGTARKPANFALSDRDYESYLDEVDAYEQKQAQVREIIYATVDEFTFLQIKGESTASEVWKKLVSMNTNKGFMFEVDLHSKLQNVRYTEGDNMRTHLTKLISIRERLAEIGSPITDKSFVSYIRTSLSLVPMYQPLFIALSASARKAGKSISSDELIWQLTNGQKL